MEQVWRSVWAELLSQITTIQSYDAVGDAPLILDFIMSILQSLNSLNNLG